MDPLGQTVRDFLQSYRERKVRTALTLAKDFRKQGMTSDQVEEMLYSGDFEKDIIDEVLRELYARTSK